MKCPYCVKEIHWQPKTVVLDKDSEGTWVADFMKCPACNKLIVMLTVGEPDYFLEEVSWDERTQLVETDEFKDIKRDSSKTLLVKPKHSSRPPVPPEVPLELADEYGQACLVLEDSPTASAALSRRCLQHLLREAAGIKPNDLANEIQQVLDSNVLPTYLAEDIDAVRIIGNFAAHPMKSKQSGEVLPVEPAEAIWNLEVLEELFDFYFVQPAKAQKRRDLLNEKLKDAGKPPMKQGH